MTVIGETFDKKAGEVGHRRRKAAERQQPARDRAPASPGALRARRNRINSGDYWLFSPDAAPPPMSRGGVVKAQPGAHLLLASDGFLALASDYGAYGADTLMRRRWTKGWGRWAKNCAPSKRPTRTARNFRASRPATMRRRCC